MAWMHLSLLTRYAGLSVLAAAATGCVSEDKYNARGMLAQQQAEQLANLQSANSGLTAENQMYKTQLSAIRNSGDNKDALVVNQTQTIADLQKQLEELNGRYRQALDGIGKAGATPLPVALTNELTSFAAQNPGLVEFDETRGMVKFKSDVTFSPGSAEVRPEAMSAIQRFGSILNGPVASQYDLMVVGHTDSQPVSNQNTIKMGHRDNWYLSAHRAIAVSKELKKQGIPDARLEIAGLADQRPVAPNDTDANKARNRRVEVLILPTTNKSAPVASAAIPASSAVKATPKPLNKDMPAVEPERKPSINK